MKYATKYARLWGLGIGALIALPGMTFAPIFSVILGASIGTLVGMLVFGILLRKERVWRKLVVPYIDEGVVHSGPAHCALGPGYMILTKLRLVWLPMAERDRHKRIEIPRAAIKQVRRAGGIGNDLHIAVSTGESVEFLTRDRKQWIACLAPPLPTASAV